MQVTGRLGGQRPGVVRTQQRDISLMVAEACEVPVVGDQPSACIVGLGCQGLVIATRHGDGRVLSSGTQPPPQAFEPFVAEKAWFGRGDGGLCGSMSDETPIVPHGISTRCASRRAGSRDSPC